MPVVISCGTFWAVPAPPDPTFGAFEALRAGVRWPPLGNQLAQPARHDMARVLVVHNLCV